MSEARSLHPEERQRLKRVAVHVVTLLPEDENDALVVLEFARELVTDYIAEPKHESGLVIPIGGNVIPISSVSALAMACLFVVREMVLLFGSGQLTLYI